MHAVCYLGHSHELSYFNQFFWGDLNNNIVGHSVHSAQTLLPVYLKDHKYRMLVESEGETYRENLNILTSNDHIQFLSFTTLHLYTIRTNYCRLMY